METAYIETTIPSYYTGRISSQSQLATDQLRTRKWWDAGCSGLRLVTSKETLTEAARGNSEMAQKRLALVADIPILPVTEQVIELAEALVSRGIVPEHVTSDAFHIAIASVHFTDYLVTWNFSHIANPFLRKRISEIALDFGCRMPVMCSPAELLKNATN